MAEMVAMDPADIKKGKRQWPLYKPFCMRPNCKNKFHREFGQERVQDWIAQVADFCF